jgi:hypothetical protein
LHLLLKLLFPAIDCLFMMGESLCLGCSIQVRTG